MADILPNETFPSDVEILLLDGTTDSQTGLPYIAKGTSPASVPSYEVQYNRRQQRENRRLAVTTEGLVVDEGGLKIGVYPCNYTLGGVRKRFAGATNQPVADNSTRYIYVDSSNALQIATAYPNNTSDHLPLAKVVAEAGKLTIYQESGFTRLAVAERTASIDINVGIETSNVISVTLSLVDSNNVAIEQPWIAEVWLSDAALGDLATTAPDGGVSVVTGTQLGAAIVSDKHIRVVSDATGTIVLDISHSGAASYYLHVNSGSANSLAYAELSFES